MFKRVILAIAIAATITACGLAAPATVPLPPGAEPVQLLVAGHDAVNPGGSYVYPDGSCYISYGQGELLPDATSGTAVRNENGVYNLAWPTGYTAFRSGDTTYVADTNGTVVVETGGWYRFFGASWGGPPGPVYATAAPGCLLEIDPFME